MFPDKLRNIFVAETISNVSSTRNIVFSIRHAKTMFKDYSASINNTLKSVLANASYKMFLGNMTKHRQETMFPQQCFLVWPGFKKRDLLKQMLYIPHCHRNRLRHLQSLAQKPTQLLDTNVHCHVTTFHTTQVVQF